MAYVDDDLTAMLEELGESLILDGTAVLGVFDVAGEVVLDGLVTTSTVALVLTSTGAALGQVLVRGSTSYRVRQVLPEPPDGLLVRLVLARV